MTKTMRCVVCPRGGDITVEYENATVISVKGNGCKRGQQYAQDEIVNPLRTLTTTVRVIGNTKTLIPVKSNAPIPKSSLFQAMEIIKNTYVTLPIKRGDVIIKDFFGAELVSCKTVDII